MRWDSGARAVQNTCTRAVWRYELIQGEMNADRWVPDSLRCLRITSRCLPERGQGVSYIYNNLGLRNVKL